MATPPTIPCPDLHDEVVVVTGGSRGIGAGSARRFAELGAGVVVSGRDPAALDAVVASITSTGGRAVGIRADCTDQAEVDALLAGTEAAFGPATVLLAFAGGDGRPEPMAQLDDTRWRAVIDTNLTATYITVRTVALGMIERGRGSIVTMSSTAGRQPGGASIAYAAAKAGVVMLTRHLAVDLAPHGVRINCIAPSAIETERLIELMPAPAREQLGQSFPLRRIGTADDVADTALFLATPQSSWITGVTIDLTGGRVSACSWSSLWREHYLQGLAPLEQLVAPDPLVQPHAVRDDRLRVHHAARHHGERLIPPPDDVRCSAELEVDGLDERGVERQLELLIAVHTDDADPSAGAGDVDAIQQCGGEPDALEHGVGAAAAGSILHKARDVHVVGVHRYRAEALGHLEALGHRVDGIDRRRLEAK